MATMLYRKCLSKSQLCVAVIRSRSQPLVAAANAYSTEPPKSSQAIRSVKDADIRKSVFISQSYDIFTNLALEDWIYRNYDFTQHHILMLWANDPCVVVGRHQNPFAETNVAKLQRSGTVLARRNSGGGTVFHDRGNLNCTFFTPRERYDRKYNLNLITRALYREWGINERDDVTLDGKKVSVNELFTEFK
jgi:lipoyltransferase 1